jgi:hypothetical protein
MSSAMPHIIKKEGAKRNAAYNLKKKARSAMPRIMKKEGAQHNAAYNLKKKARSAMPRIIKKRRFAAQCRM